MELLFEGRREIVGKKGRVIAFQTSAKLSPEPVLRGDTNADGAAVVLYGTVIKDGGLYRMWYQAAPRTHAWDSDFAYVAHAESEDGWVWKKRALRLKEENGIPAGHLTNLGLHSPSIMKTGDGFLASGCVKRAIGANPNAPGPGYYLARSDDGLDWQLSGHRLYGGDVITGIWDDRFQRGEVACKYLRYHGGLGRRAIFNASFDPGGWGKPNLALMPTEADDQAAMARGCRSADYYGMSWLPAGAKGMLGFVWMFYHVPPYSKGMTGIFGGGALTLAYREEPGAAWVMVPGRVPFLDHPDGPAWNRFFYAASTPVACGDEQRLYATVFRQSHGWMLNEDRKRDPAALRQLREEGLATIHVAAWKRDRFFGFRAETEADLFLAPEPAGGPAVLKLNTRTGNRGWIKVRVSEVEESFVPGFSPLPEEALPGFDFEDCQPIAGDQVAVEVVWKENRRVAAPGPGKKLIVTLRLFMAECYAYEWVED